jgi:glycosyltransferase involved in cell wall biosynthesis
VSQSGPLRILALLEANSITGTGKAVLEMAYEAMADVSGGREVRISVANFVRGDVAAENALTKALGAARIPYSLIEERGRFDRSVIPQIRDVVKKYSADVIWSNSVKSHFLVRQAQLKKLCRWVAFHHGYTSTDFKMRLYNELDRVSLRNANRVLTVCQPFAREMEARGVNPSRIRIQHMPIRRFSNPPGDAATLRAELKLDPDSKVILSIGRLSHEKGHKDLLTAFQQVLVETKDERLRLVLVGDGPEQANLERQAGDCDMSDRILFAGHRDDAKRFYGIASVFALPSYTEGTPNVLLEAMAAGVPVVATSVGGVPELASDGKNALLVPAARPEELVRALLRIVQAGNEPRPLGLAEAAQAVVDAHAPRFYFEGMRKVFLEAVSE